MQFCKGTISNVNKKIVTATLVFTLSMTSLVGCSNVSIDDIKYTENPDGYVEGITETVSYDVLKYCSFFAVYNNKTKERYYTIGLMDEWNGSYFVKYYDIFTKEEWIQSDFTFHSVGTVKNYLAESNIVKEEYAVEELETLLNRFVESLNKEKSKQLVKEK